MEIDIKEIFKMVWKKVKECLYTMAEIGIMGILTMMFLMAAGYYHLAMEIFTKGNFIKDFFMDLENITMSVVTIIKVSGYMEKRKEKDFYRHLDKHIMANGQIIWKWELDNIFGKTEINSKETL